MTFAAYIERQKGIIKNRHEEELALAEIPQETEFCDSEKLFKDLWELKGLNTYERLNLRSRV